MKIAAMFLVLVVTVAAAAGASVAGSNPGVCRPAFGAARPAEERPATSGDCEDTTVIAYDDGIHQTWWCSDKDSFGAAVRFTPGGYPCYVVGAQAEVGWDTTSGSSQIYLRVFDDDGAGGLPGTVLYEEHRTDVPRGKKEGFREYGLTSPLTVDSGEFYLCFWQKHYFNMLFGSDTHFDSIARQWWFFPDQGWVTPSGMDAADHLIRARVLYSTGVEESIKPQASNPKPFSAIVRGVLFLPKMETVPSGTVPIFAALLDATGRRVQALRPGANDVRALAPGVYFVRAEPSAVSREPSAITKVVVAR